MSARAAWLVANTAIPSPTGPAVYRSAQAQIARAGDAEGRVPECWFPAFKVQEAAFGIDDARMGEPTFDILRRIAAAPLAARRRVNAAILARHLPDLALWPDLQWDFPPLAFPIRVQDCAGLAANLATVGIYCARHWGRSA